MEKKTIILSVFVAMLSACNNDAKDSVEKADSINDAKRDTAISRADLITDEQSSDFLVRAANAGLAEMEMTNLAQKNATIQQVRDFAGMLHADHRDLHTKITALAAVRKLVLPAQITADKQKMITDLNSKTGKNFDKDFIREIISGHEQSITLFENAFANAKDSEVKTFANDVLPRLRIHLDSAKAIQKIYW